MNKYKQLNQNSYSNHLYVLKNLEGNSSYLVYRDIPILLAKYVSKSNTDQAINILDIGCSIGTSIFYFHNALKIYQRGFKFTGVDVNNDALNVARQRFPNVNFHQISENDTLEQFGKFDLIICNFVLVEMHSDQMTEILSNARKILTKHGLMFVTNPTLDIYNPQYDWYGINNKFDTNTPNNIFGKKGFVTDYTENQAVTLQVVDPETKKEIITFHDFIHSEHAYNTAYQKAGLHLLDRHYPLGTITDKIPWLSEIHKPRLRIDILSCN